MGTGEEGAHGVADGGTKGGAIGGIFDYRAGMYVSGRIVRKWNWRIEGGRMLVYRSMMVIRGETRPEAQAAAVKSETTRHGKLFVFQV